MPTGEFSSLVMHVSGAPGGRESYLT